MNIEKSFENGKLTIKVEGRLDAITAPELEKVLDESLDITVRELIWEFSNLVYISSAGLRVILKAQKQMKHQGDMKIVNASRIIRGVFEMVGFNIFVNIK